MRKIVTLDIGGTNIKIGIFEDEVLVQEAEMPTPLYCIHQTIYAM